MNEGAGAGRATGSDVYHGIIRGRQRHRHSAVSDGTYLYSVWALCGPCDRK